MGKISKDHIDKWYDYDIDMDNRTLWIGSILKDIDSESGVDAALSERVIKGLHVLEKSASAGDKPIKIIINNPGGCETEGLAIYDAIKACKNHVTITVYGKCWSMAGYILQAADERIMTPTSSFMLHEGTRGLPTDHPRIVKNWNKWHDYVDEFLFELYFNKIKEKHPHFSKKKLEDMLKFDTILTAKEAVELGLADSVLEYD
jgi:ATP-dependent Clp protease protease subunit